MIDVVFRPEARAEILASRDWYEGRSEGLGDAFVRAVEDRIAHIQAYPYASARIAGEVRRAPLDRFPYVIMYAPERTFILVISCFHTSRDPESWRQRLGH